MMRLVMIVLLDNSYRLLYNDSANKNQLGFAVHQSEVYRCMIN